MQTAATPVRPRRAKVLWGAEAVEALVDCWVKDLVVDGRRAIDAVRGGRHAVAVETVVGACGCV